MTSLKTHSLSEPTTSKGMSNPLTNLTQSAWPSIERLKHPSRSLAIESACFHHVMHLQTVALPNYSRVYWPHPALKHDGAWSKYLDRLLNDRPV